MDGAIKELKARTHGEGAAEMVRNRQAWKVPTYFYTEDAVLFCRF